MAAQMYPAHAPGFVAHWAVPPVRRAAAAGVSTSASIGIDRLLGCRLALPLAPTAIRLRHIAPDTEIRNHRLVAVIPLVAHDLGDPRRAVHRGDIRRFDQRSTIVVVSPASASSARWRPSPGPPRLGGVHACGRPSSSDLRRSPRSTPSSSSDRTAPTAWASRSASRDASTPRPCPDARMLRIAFLRASSRRSQSCAPGGRASRCNTHGTLLGCVSRSGGVARHGEWSGGASCSAKSRNVLSESAARHARSQLTRPPIATHSVDVPGSDPPDASPASIRWSIAPDNLLGVLMAKERSSRSQLFIATHSVDVINGLLNVAPDNLRVLRILRDGDVNHVKELDKERAKQINADPLMKYSSVMSGVFHERVIICEADSDCTFYSSLLNLRELHGDHQPDVLFVHANGKDRIGALVKTLTELDVPVDVIVDIDILRSADVFEDITKSLGGNWVDIQPMVKAIRSSIDDNKSWSNAGAIKKEIQRELEDIESKGEFPKETRVAINIILKKGSPWFTVKAAGEAAIPKGQATQHFHNLKSSCKKMGLWIVPVGELEGFCRSVGGHGPRWVQQVIETSDLSRDSNLQGARDFVREIWAARSSG